MAMLRARHMKSCVLMWDGWLEESKQDRSSLTLNHWLCPLLCSSPLAEQQRVYSAAFWEWSAVKRTGTQPLLQLQPAADATDLFARRKHLFRRVFLPHSLLSHFIVIELRGGGAKNNAVTFSWPHCMFVTSLRGGGMKTKAHSTECKQDAIHFLHPCVQLLFFFL